MNLTRLAVRRPVGVLTLVMALLLFGGIAWTGLGLDFLPRLDFPLVAVATVYPGADPENIETAVTVPLETSISSISGLRRLRSTSMDNVSFITAEFDWNVDVDQAVKELETALAVTHRFLPDEVEAPIVLRTDPNQMSLMLVAVAGVDHLTPAVESRIISELEQIQGVAAVNLLGAQQSEVTVLYDSQALHEHGLTPTLIQQILAAQNVIVPAGTITDSGRTYSVRAGQVYENIEALRNQTIALQSPQESGVGLFSFAAPMPIRLRDVADIHIGPVPRDGITRVNQSPAVILQVMKQSDANAAVVSKAVEKRLAEIESDTATSVTFHVLTNQTDLIDVSLSNLSSAGIVGGLLATAVLIFFLKELGALAVIALAIPLSITGSLIALYFMGVTLNIMSLGGLAMAVGMLVDNAIVVLENIARRRSLGEDPVLAAAEGGSEIGPAIFASTLTTLVVFLPLVFLKSLVGMLFRETGISVSVSLIASLIIALTVIPTISARLRRKADSRRSIPATDRRPEWYQSTYAKALEWWTQRRWPAFVLILLLIVGIITLPATLETQFLPKTDGGIVTARFTLPPGSTIDDSDTFADEMEARILSLPEVATVLTLAGDQGSEDLLARVQSLGPHEIQLTVVLRDRRDRRRSAEDIAGQILGWTDGTSVKARIESDRTTEALGDDFFAGLTLQATGSDYTQIESVVDHLTRSLAEDGRFHNITNNLKEGQPQLFFQVTERSFQGAHSGGEPLTAGQVGLALRQHLTGLPATHAAVDGENIPVVLRPQPDETASINAVSGFRVPGFQLSMGTSASPLILDRIAEIIDETGFGVIHRLDRMRTAHVQAQLHGIGLAQAKDVAQALIDDLDLPPGYSVHVGGLHQVIDESVGDILWVLLIAATLVYMVMAVQFESFLQPLVIMGTIPLAAVGAFGALKITGNAMGIPAFIGFLLLIGISVNHGIIMIDFINAKLREGTPRRTAVLQGAAIRLRPILMTTITTILGLAPLAAGWGEGAEILSPLAISVIGGLLSSSLLTLFLIPSMLLIGRSLRGETTDTSGRIRASQ